MTLSRVSRTTPVALALLTACACGAATSTPASTTTTTATGGAAGYDVHEWGLVRALPGDVLNVGAIAPARMAYPMAVDKPVLYFHADAPLTLASVRVDAGEGTLAEVWPEPPRTGEASVVNWRDVALAPSGDCPFSPLPGLGDPACTSLPAGELCEVAQLGVVRVPGVACVRTAGVTDSLLFYRARTRSFTPPLRFERVVSGGEDVTVTNEGTEVIPGWLVRLRDDYGSVRALAVRPPAPGASIVVGSDFAAAADTGPVADDEAVDMPVMPGSPEPGRRALRETMIDIGLTDGEADAFLRAWDERLFALAPSTVADGTPIDTLAADRRGMDEDGDPGPMDSFVYFLPEASVDGIARVTFDPPPRSFHRAMAIWSPIRPSGASH